MKMKILFLTLLVVKPDLLLAASDEDGQSCNNIADQNPTRPCQANDISCISNYFQSFFSGTPADCECGPDKVILDKVQVILPNINLTINFYDIQITGLSTGNVTDFIVDYDTDVAVLTTVFETLQINSSAHYYYVRPYEESIQLYTQVYESYPGLTVVTVFESANNPSPPDSFSVASGGPNPYVDIGPCLTETQDPVVQELTQQIIASYQITVSEALLPRAKYIARAFLDETILCYDQ